MFDEIPYLRQTPRRQIEFAGKQTADIGAKQHKGKIHNHQRQQKIRHRKADKADGGQNIIHHGILPHRRINAQRQRNAPCQDEGGEGQSNGQPQTVTNHFRNRAVPFHRFPEIAHQNARHPFDILDIDRLIEAIENAQASGLFGGDRTAGRRQIGDIGIDKITGRGLNDDERQNGNRRHGDDSQNRTSCNIGQHGWITPS